MTGMFMILGAMGGLVPGCRSCKQPLAEHARWCSKHPEQVARARKGVEFCAKVEQAQEVVGALSPVERRALHKKLAKSMDAAIGRMAREFDAKTLHERMTAGFEKAPRKGLESPAARAMRLGEPHSVADEGPADGPKAVMCPFCCEPHTVVVTLRGDVTDFKATCNRMWVYAAHAVPNDRLSDPWLDDKVLRTLTDMLSECAKNTHLQTLSEGPLRADGLRMTDALQASLDMELTRVVRECASEVEIADPWKAHGFEWQRMGYGWQLCRLDGEEKKECVDALVINGGRWDVYSESMDPLAGGKAVDAESAKLAAWRYIERHGMHGVAK